MMKIWWFAVTGWLGCVGAVAVSIHPTFAQLTPDNSLGKERSQVIPFNPNNDRIEGGATRGTNLFHSFQNFNVGDGRGVYFANPQGITNIFSRVTGGNSSNIFGNLGVLGNANLFLLNPNGIVFGKNASLDLQGSFLGTTANSLVFPNAVEFSATNPQAPPLLTINVPIGLQSGSQPGNITNKAVNALYVGSGSTLALLGGEIALDGSYLFTQNGQIKLAAVSGDTTVGLNVDGSSLGFNLPENVGRAPINLTNGRIIATGENSAIELFGGKIALNGTLSYLFSFNGGSIVVDATQLNLDNSARILSATTGAAKGGDIQIQASDAVTLANGSRIFSSSNDIGAGGDLTINAGKITITGDGTPENSSYISTLSGGKGNGGNLTFNATESVNFNGGLALIGTSGVGNAGNLIVRAKDALNITNQGDLLLSSSSSGSTGNLRIETGTLRVQNNFPTSVMGVLASGSGNVGSIFIHAQNAVEVTQGNISTGVFLPVGGTTPAKVGDITIETQRLNLKDRSDISTTTLSNANAANISIKASEQIDISGSDISSNTYGSGNGGNITIETPRLSLTQGSYISSDTFLGSGNGGNVIIKTPQLSLTEGGHIDTSSTQSSGNAGNIIIRAKNVEVDGGMSRFQGLPDISDLSSQVFGSNADVKGGTITIDTENLRLSNGGNISTSVLGGRGQGGNLVVHANNSIDITGVGLERPNGSSGLFADLQTGGIGSAGNIDVTTGRLNLSNGGQISASTLNQGNAGNITINAEQIDLGGLDSELLTGITSSVYERANGKGGDIDITTNKLDISDNAQIISGSLGTGDAGNIKINANVLKIIGKLSAIASSTNAGNGGDINLNIANLLLLRDGAFISTTAGINQAGGDGGNININSKFIVAIPKENSDIKANAYTGSGGRVQINSQGIFGIESRPKPTEKSDITASSELGVSGITNINAPDTSSIQNSFSGLSPNVIDTNALIANSCIVRSSKQKSTFFITGSGGLRNSPGDGLISNYSTGEVRNVEPISRTWKKGDAIVEPQGLYQLADGSLILSRECH
ncbi:MULTISPECIES: filamentous hemagglutinin N-terminal domain-containing protein [unclassified Nostoc]|uniref:two-partner secretion domain-containing protein n=1 Tax=unclassified Nostoc TaxID=2593658 RepID=UPI002AD1F0D4|nr:filamentous hemagglutinin N-terminal domain-containing protein [Nostoc sp. DedQUE03]MDZ7974166.1 filamentous hemagglutinin N-terminal domain-containing protein [Nostoc sp. DedQUE03]MDZ8042820.1 filamentous hemagglutinin N-terminal domain-containing protein [Nostoc sp. DedQUE02]